MNLKSRFERFCKKQFLKNAFDLNNQNLIFISLLILFSKNSIDWADGLLARVKKQTSTLGAMLDDWAALVSSYSYLIGLGIYLYHNKKIRDRLVQNNYKVIVDLHLFLK